MSNAPAEIATIPYAKPHIWGNELVRVREIIEAGWLSSQGDIVGAFEKSFASAVDASFALATSSGTSALHLAMLAAGIEREDEVIVPGFTMIAPVFAVCHCGARPVPVDVDDTWNIDVTGIERRLTRRTRAIVVVHTYGHPARIDEIISIARDHRLVVIEDAAEALGATINGQFVGALGDIGCHSLYANKVITTGEGGMLTTNDENMVRRARWKGNMCFGADQEHRFIHDELGFNYRLSAVQAAIGVAQLEHLRAAVERKVAIAERYDELLAGMPGVTRPPAAAWVRNVYWAYGILIDEAMFGHPRECVQRMLRQRGIDTRRMFTPVHRQPFLDLRSSDTEFPMSMRLADEGILLPSFIDMSDAQIDRVVETIDDIRTGRLAEA
jgi:perosamine synthetase